MERLLATLGAIEDTRQSSKITYCIWEVVLLALFAVSCRAENWVEIETFGNDNLDLLREYYGYEAGIPDHGTISRIMGIVEPETMQEIHLVWQEEQGSLKDLGPERRKLLHLDGKTSRGNTQNGDKPAHIVSAYSSDSGVCMAQTCVEEKSNEITAIPKVLDLLSVENAIITIDAMGTQRAIARKIRDGGGDYVLALKGNQSAMHDDIIEYFSDGDILEELKSEGLYLSQVEKAHGQIERREYWQSGDIDWLDKSKWDGLATVVCERSTITKGAETATSMRYFISSLEPDINLAARSVRSHWSVESMHWHLDYTFREDDNHTINKIAAQNLNIIRKWSLSVLKKVDVPGQKKASMRVRAFHGHSHPEKILDAIGIRAPQRVD